ncbi:MAG: hypothetical protein PF542_06200 [Nanoarchaeota archaeon]|jgi:hypothetical protein|nr:hypothetical protein [Nanoarchaeota archaeon]
MESNKFLIYKSSKEEISVNIIFRDETIWATQKVLAQLFGVGVNTINYHLRDILQSKELIEDGTVRNFRIVQKENSC